MATRDEDEVWIQICYFVEFEKDNKGFWTRKLVGDDEEGNVTEIHARKSISYDELYKKVMEELKIDSRLYELEMQRENPVPSGFPEPPMKIDCDDRVRFLMENLDTTKLSLTLKKKAFRVVESGASIECLEKSHNVDVDVDVDVDGDGDGRDVCVISCDSSETHRVEKSHNIATDGNGRDGYGIDGESLALHGLEESQNIVMDGYNADTYGLGGKRPWRGVVAVDPSLLCSSDKDVLNALQSSFVRKKRIVKKQRTEFGQDKHLLSVGHELDVRGDYRGEAPIASVEGSITGQRRCCLHCGTATTQEWRVGPMGPNTLCNACGLRYKFGRLVPEYRPACNPTFSSRLHSNSNRKIIVMKKQKQQVVGDACAVRHEVDVRGDDRGEAPTAIAGGSITEQRKCCLHCGTDTTPQWHVGPMGPDTLCNACRLDPEYHPACSPTSSAAKLHSNSHRKIIVVRKQKQQVEGNAGHEVDVREKCRGEATTAIVGGSVTGQRKCCLHCGTDTTPWWHVGPMGPDTLCNACHLDPEYHPVCSPTSSATRLHSNSHRKIARKQKKQVEGNARHEEDVRENCRGEAQAAIVRGSVTGQRKCCLHCGTDMTPRWRFGPMGTNTLCNACGLSYKSGRLVPEYRPACSLTSSSNRLHSNCRGEAPTAIVGGSITGQRRCCLHCGSDTTPQWRVGPMGPNTLCNACGLSYKNGCLVPEYRPARSPTFSAGLHSNYHGKIIDMRIQKQHVVGMVKDAF